MREVFFLFFYLEHILLSVIYGRTVHYFCILIQYYVLCVRFARLFVINIYDSECILSEDYILVVLMDHPGYFTVRSVVF
jgi:hypothetical protein